MGARKNLSEPSEGPRVDPPSNFDEKANPLAAEKSPPQGNAASSSEQETQRTEDQAERIGPWWHNWWREFRAEFHTAHPDKQLSEIYYISGILAVTASLVAGLWALGHQVLFERSPPEGKHLSRPIETTVPAQHAPASALSLVVLPFVNLSGTAAQEYFADGVTDSLTTDLSRALPGSFVIARETAFTYKGKATDARQIGRELNVRYALEGSVLTDGDQVRINARLLDAQLGNEIWAERFDTPRTGLLQVQDEIVGRLSRAIGLQVIGLAAQRSEREKPKSAEAIDLVLRGEATLNRPSSAETMIEARGLFEQVLKLQPDNVDALAGVATTYIFEVLNGYYPNDNELRLARAEPLLARALALDDRHLVALKARAGLLRAQGRFDDAIAAAQTVIMENPGEPWAYKEVALSTMYLGRTTDAIDWFGKAERLGPRDPGRWTWLGGKGQSLLLLGRDDEAIASLRSAIEANSADVGDYAVLAAAYALSGRNEEAHAALAQYDRAQPGTTVGSFRNLSPVPLKLTDPSYRRQRERLKDGLRKAGMSN
jgi:TolB-like protein/cytochrome c-type biogenesis protein CcmH/NrfG